VLDLPQSYRQTNAGLRWTPDGRALTYVDTTDGVSNIWSLPLDGGKPVQLTNFKTDQIFWFNFSRDGKQLVLSRGTETSDVVLIRNFR
jgi:Tol biopolymer transport system component